jgi:large subunit ribosomal protein L29
MAKNKNAKTAKDFRSMSGEDIAKNISEANTQLKRLIFNHAITPIENPMAIRTLRREIAKLQTEQRRKQIGF